MIRDYSSCAGRRFLKSFMVKNSKVISAFPVDICPEDYSVFVPVQPNPQVQRGVYTTAASHSVSPLPLPPYFFFRVR